MSKEKKIDFSKPVSPAAGTWPCIVIDGSAGEELVANSKPTGRIKARVNVQLEAGPDKGRLVSYEDEINAKSSLYIRRSLMACGWRGNDLETVKDDIAKWVAKTGGKSTVEIRHIEIKNGKRYNEWVDAWYEQTGRNDGRPPLIWPKANSIGRGPKPLAAPTKEALGDANDFMRMAAEAEGSAPPHDDAPHAADGDDLPFATSSMVRDQNGQVI